MIGGTIQQALSGADVATIEEQLRTATTGDAITIKLGRVGGSLSGIVDGKPSPACVIMVTADDERVYVRSRNDDVYATLMDADTEMLVDPLGTVRAINVA